MVAEENWPATSIRTRWKQFCEFFLYFTVFSAKLNLWKNEVEKIKENFEESQRRKRRDIDYEMHYGHDKSGPAFGQTIFDEFMTGGSGDYDQVLWILLNWNHTDFIKYKIGISGKRLF